MATLRAPPEQAVLDGSTSRACPGRWWGARCGVGGDRALVVSGRWRLGRGAGGLAAGEVPPQAAPRTLAARPERTRRTDTSPLVLRRVWQVVARAVRTWTGTCSTVHRVRPVEGGGGRKARRRARGTDARARAEAGRPERAGAARDDARQVRTVAETRLHPQPSDRRLTGFDRGVRADRHERANCASAGAGLTSLCSALPISGRTPA